MPSFPSLIISPRPTKIAKMEDSIDVVTATTSVQPIPDYRPDAKTRRYDRQLRLWASAGQKSLEQARILLVGCDATGCQALKNLVLPGIAHFTILSPLLTTSQDVATNFFLHPDSIGMTIAGETVKYLKELNPSVHGEARPSDPADLIIRNPEFFTSFTLIIASNIEPSLELQLADLLWSASANVGGPDIPLIAIRNSGFIGRVEIQLREHCVIDTHPDTTHTLRIDQPFPALEDYSRSLDLATMDSMEHSHIPWVILLVRAGSLWKASHGGSLPSTSEEKEEFKKLVNADRIKGDEENFDEAVAQAYRVWMKSEVPYELTKLLSENVRNINRNSKNLHILLHALGVYLKSPPALLPTSPTLPDMHSSTASYIALQNLYRAQAAADLETFKKILEEILEEIGLPADSIPEEEVEGFVKNTGGVGIIQGNPLRDAKEVKGLLRENIESEFSDGASPSLPLALHLSLLASERFYSSEGRWPGSSPTADVSADAQLLEEKVVENIRSVIPKCQIPPPDEIVESVAEIARGGFCTLPTTAAFLGGIVAQEAIKLVTAQYTPLENTVIVDFVKSTIEKFKF